MIEIRQDLAFITKAVEHGIGIHAALHNLDRDFLTKLIVGPNRPINSAHSTAAQFRNDLIGSGALPH